MGVRDAVAATFRDSAGRLSILIHGNNHVPGELLRHVEASAILATAAQALRRMERLKRRHNLDVARVMEAPHGALADSTMPHLLSLGYEAALATTELLVHHNPETKWPPAFGMDCAEMLGGGLPVLPRTMMSPLWRNDMTLRAFLRQPIVIAGHQGDAAGGLDFLAEMATALRGLPGAQWSDVPGILESNYQQRRTGRTLALRLCSRKAKVAFEPGLRILSVWRPWLPENRSESLRIAFDSLPPQTVQAGRFAEIQVPEHAVSAQIQSEFANPINPDKVKAPPRRPWPIARKVAMEFRDRVSRFLPVANRLRRSTAANGGAGNHCH
jgi:hypothetical protein